MNLLYDKMIYTKNTMSIINEFTIQVVLDKDYIITISNRYAKKWVFQPEAGDLNGT